MHEEETMMVRSGLFGPGGDAVALLGVEVRAEVLAGHASAAVRQRYKNAENKPIEAVYTFPLPTKAVLTGFSMTVEGRRIDGEVHEREDAFRRYDDAITAGHGGALLEQERPNVFTANVGNLLPGEETIIELQYVEPVLADEGAVRWSIPTVVAPRYVPGVASGDRTAHGTANPTHRVPDADRISPPIGDAPYGLALDLSFDLGVALDIESPSHAVVVTHEEGKARVRFSQSEVPLDRDIVVAALAKSAATEAAPIASALSHRRPQTATGTFALTLVPDLGAGHAKAPASRAEVVFLLDRSGSMGGVSIQEARTALRLCLRQLREGDRFNVLAFDDVIESFAPSMVPFTQATLQRADEWLAGVDARGGTELLQPILEAAKLAPDGLVVVLTDGQVGNEDEILAAFSRAHKSARVYSFGIGTNVSDALLQSLADQSGGAVEMIYPGERIDEKVVAQFARATAPRVTELTIKARGIELGEIAPAEPSALVDGEPFCLFATYEVPGRGAIEIRGKLGGESFFLEVPVELAEASDRPVLAKLWAQARVRDLERAVVTGRRAEAMKDRIVKLAVEHGVSSRYTSMLVVEKRTGDRRASGQPETRVIPVNAPAGWAMFRPAPVRGRRFAAMPAPARSFPAGGFLPARPMMPSPMAPPAVASGAPRAVAAALGKGGASAVPPTVLLMEMPASAPAPSAAEGLAPRAKSESVDRPGALLSRQAASGLWEEGGDATASTVDALVALLRSGLSTSHAIYGAQIKKAIEALLMHLQDARVEPALRELALGVAWLLASGRRTRRAIEDAARASVDLTALAATLGDEAAVRAHVDRLHPA
jgi:Ca-activated chloride channel family protein